MSELQALKEAVDWVWKCHYKFHPASPDDKVLLSIGIGGIVLVLRFA